MNIVSSNRAILIVIFIIYLALAPTQLVESGIIRFFPTLVLMLIFICGLLCIGESKNARMGSIITCLCIYIIFCSFIHPYKEDGLLTTIIKSSYWCWIYFISFSMFSVKKIENNFFDNCVLFVSILLFISFNYNHISRSSIGLLVGDNSVFYPLMLLPWISCTNNTIKRWLMVLLVSVCAIIALKRSGIIILLVSISLLYYKDFLHGNLLQPMKLILGIVVILGGFVVYQSMSSSISDVSQRFKMLEDDGGNGRKEIYEDVINRYKTGNIIEILIGRGFNSVTGTDTTRALSAHNDFLEVLYDFGLIGFFFYLLIHLSLIKWIVSLFRARSQLAFPVLISYICFIVMSMVSHLILYPTYFGLLVSFWAFAECKNQELIYRSRFACLSTTYSVNSYLNRVRITSWRMDTIDAS